MPYLRLHTWLSWIGCTEQRNTLGNNMERKKEKDVGISLQKSETEGCCTFGVRGWLFEYDIKKWKLSIYAYVEMY